MSTQPSVDWTKMGTVWMKKGGRPITYVYVNVSFVSDLTRITKSKVFVQIKKSISSLTNLNRNIKIGCSFVVT